MPYAMFHHRFPGIARRETRTFKVLDGSELPAGDYDLLEMYCDEPGCDCRRVFFYVISSATESVAAVVAYGWEHPSFYAKWMGAPDPQTIRELKGPTLDLGSPQSGLAPAILSTVANVVLRDEAYVDRLKCHYRMFKERVDAGSKPARTRRRSRGRRRSRV